MKTIFLYFFQTRKNSLALIAVTILISVASFYLMNGFVESLQKKLYNSARSMSASDIKISTWQNWKPEWDSILSSVVEGRYQRSEMIQFPTMVSKGGEAFLVSVKAVDSLYPLYGSVKLKDGQRFDLKANSGYLAYEASVRFGVSVGDELQVGKETIKISGLLEELPDQGFSGSSAFSPTLLVPIELADKTGLLQFGSRVQRIKHYKIIDQKYSQERIERDADDLEAQLGTDSIQVSTWKDAQNMSRNLFERMGGYFNILTYTAVILSSIGLFLGLSAFSLKIQEDCSILFALGVSKNRLKKSLFIIFILMTGISCCLGVFVGILGENYLLRLIEDSIVLRPNWEMNYKLVLFTSIFAVLSCGVVVYFSISRSINVLNGFDYRLSFVKGRLYFVGFFLYIGFVFMMLGFYTWFVSGSVKNAIVLNTYIVGLLIFIFLFVASLLYIFNLLVNLFQSKPVVYLASIEFFRNKRQHLPSLIGLVLSGVLVLGLLSTRDSLSKGLSVESKKDMANVFLVDVQKSQLEGVQKFIDSNDGYRNFNYSPLIRAGLTQINGVSIDLLKSQAKLSEDVRKQRFLSRSYNLTYKDKLNESEEIIDGSFWGEDYVGPNISVEADFANTMGIKIGDQIGFDLAGLEITGTVGSIRRINWSSLLPNFFVVFPKSKLENAPQFIIGSAHIDSAMLPNFQNQLHQKYSNVSVVDLSVIFAKVKSLISKVLQVISTSSSLCVIASLLILISAIYTGDNSISKKYDLMKSLGMRHKSIWQVFYLEKLFFLITLVVSVALLLFAWGFVLSNFMKEKVEFPFLYLSFFVFLMASLLAMPLLQAGLKKNHKLS